MCSNLHALRGCHTALCLRWDGALAGCTMDDEEQPRSAAELRTALAEYYAQRDAVRPVPFTLDANGLYGCGGCLTASLSPSAPHRSSFGWWVRPGERVVGERTG